MHVLILTRYYCKEKKHNAIYKICDNCTEADLYFECASTSQPFSGWEKLIKTDREFIFGSLMEIQLLRWHFKGRQTYMCNIPSYSGCSDTRRTGRRRRRPSAQKGPRMSPYSAPPAWFFDALNHSIQALLALNHSEQPPLALLASLTSRTQLSHWHFMEFQFWKCIVIFVRRSSVARNQNVVLKNTF